jgi:hypothetical protein
MVLNAGISPFNLLIRYTGNLLGEREVNGLPMGEVFGGKQVENLIKALKTATRESQTIETGPILASVHGALDADGAHFIHSRTDQRRQWSQRHSPFFCKVKSRLIKTSGWGKSPFSLNEVVTLANCALQDFTIGDMQLAATIFNCFHRLKHTGCNSDSGTTSTNP